MRHNQRGYSTLKDLPQRAPISSNSFSTGWEEFDQYLRLYLGQFIVLTGVAGHGKSTFLLNIVCNIARNDGIRSFLYVPENEAHIKTKLRGIWDNDRTFRVFEDSQCYVQSALPLGYDDPPKTLQWVLEQAEISIEKDGVSFLVIDPWNELERAKPKDMLLSDYIGHCLMMLKQFCRAYEVIICMVAHPTKAVNENGGRTATLADIEGSMNWFNKCDNGLVVVRGGDDTCKVISSKVREIGAGSRGECAFFVDPRTGKFTPQIGAPENVLARREEARNRGHYGQHRGDSGPSSIAVLRGQ